MKLNLGCGPEKMDGYINVDKYSVFNPDIIQDLEITPWNFEDNSVDEIVMHHVMEHLGQTSEQFLNILKELYRISKPNCIIEIFVPHPYHLTFIGDPTHVRPITPEMFQLFDKDVDPNSPLLLSTGIHFKVINLYYEPDIHYRNMLNAGQIKYDEVVELSRQLHNVCVETKFRIQVIKE